MSKKQFILEDPNNKNILHIPECPYIRKNTQEVKRLPKKYTVCPNCEKMFYILKGDKKALLHQKEYERFFEHIDVGHIKQFYEEGGMTEWWNDMLFLHYKQDNWKIEMNLFNPEVLWHNNYCVKDGKRVFLAGYHQQKTGKTPKKMFRTILWYTYNENMHKK